MKIGAKFYTQTEMEKRRRVCGNAGIEENMMAILATSGFHNSKVSHHLNDDRLDFLEAVRSGCLLSEEENAPTQKMFDAIFHILRDAESLDLIVQSYQLLIELDKRFPRLCLCKGEESESSSMDSSRLVIVEEDWVPFNFGMDSGREETLKHSSSYFDSLGFNSLIQVVTNSEAVDITLLKNILLLQYLITVLEADFSPRNSAYQENMNWTLLKESLLNTLLGSRKMLYKGFIKDCLSLICHLSKSIASEEANSSENSSRGVSHEIDTALALSMPQLKKSACIMVKNFLLMIMELDSSKQLADQQGFTTRADGVRTRVVDIILEELIYDNDILHSFLQVFDEPKWKLEIIVQYFQKYIPKSVVQTRRSSNNVNSENFDGVLKCLSNTNSMRNIIKKISSEVVQLLLAYAFHAYLAQSHQHSEGFSDPAVSSSIVDICRNVVSAFTCLRQADRDMELMGSSKEALFTAATILSTKS